MDIYRILPVLENKKLGPYNLLKIEDRESQNKVSCGQFLMVGFSDTIDPFLLRPFSYFEIDRNSFSILVKKRGLGTEMLSNIKRGEYLKILGPVGKPFHPPDQGVLIAGGIGIAPLYFQANFMEGGIFFYGVTKKEEFIYLNNIKKRGFDMKTISEQGKRGGTVCDLVNNNLDLLRGKKIFICGPEPMLKASKKVLKGYEKNAFLYIERRMGCGLGGCKSCAIKTKTGYKLVCQDGPIFPLSEVLFD